MLSRFMGRFVNASYALLRTVAGLAFAFHGVQKIFGVLTDHPTEFGSQIWVGGAIELVCGFLIAGGLFTVAAAFLASGTMAVAYFQFHWKGQMGTGFFPAINQGELALIYCFVFLYIACRGPGVFSLDRFARKTAP